MSNFSQSEGGGGGAYVSDDTIFIAGLPEDTNEDQLSEYFGQIGIIKFDKRNKCPKIWIYKDKTTGKGKGEATITYDDPPTATSAITWFNGKEFKGSTITVQLAQRKSIPQFLTRGGGRGGPGRGGSGGHRFEGGHRGGGGGGYGDRDRGERADRDRGFGGGRGFDRGAGGRGNNHFDRGSSHRSALGDQARGGSSYGDRHRHSDHNNKTSSRHDETSSRGAGLDRERDRDRDHRGGASGADHRGAGGYGDRDQQHHHQRSAGAGGGGPTRGHYSARARRHHY